MRKVGGTLKLLRSAQANKAAHKLTCAGWRHKDAIVRFCVVKVALPFLFGGIAVVLLYVRDAYSMTSTWKAGTALGATLFGAYLPDIMVYNAAQKRREAIRKSLPDALDLMVICAEAGLSHDAPLMRVAEEMQKPAAAP